MILRGEDVSEYIDDKSDKKSLVNEIGETDVYEYEGAPYKKVIHGDTEYLYRLYGYDIDDLPIVNDINEATAMIDDGVVFMDEDWEKDHKRYVSTYC